MHDACHISDRQTSLPKAVKKKRWNPALVRVIDSAINIKPLSNHISHLLTAAKVGCTQILHAYVNDNLLVIPCFQRVIWLLVLYWSNSFPAKDLLVRLGLGQGQGGFSLEEWPTKKFEEESREPPQNSLALFSFSLWIVPISEPDKSS